MKTEQYIKLQLKAEELREKRKESDQAISNLYKNGFITLEETLKLSEKIKDKYITERLKIEKKINYLGG